MKRGKYRSKRSKNTEDIPIIEEKKIGEVPGGAIKKLKIKINNGIRAG